VHSCVVVHWPELVEHAKFWTGRLVAALGVEEVEMTQQLPAAEVLLPPAVTIVHKTCNGLASRTKVLNY
jgi:hypothetical protein